MLEILFGVAGALFLIFIVVPMVLTVLIIRLQNKAKEKEAERIRKATDYLLKQTRKEKEDR